MADSKTLSVSNWRIRSPRLAPRAVRMAISRWRPAARASSRLATLAQAIRRTKPTAPTRISRAGRTSPTSASRRGNHRDGFAFIHPLGIGGAELLAARPSYWPSRNPESRRASGGRQRADSGLDWCCSDRPAWEENIGGRIGMESWRAGFRPRCTDRRRAGSACRPATGRCRNGFARDRC